MSYRPQQREAGRYLATSFSVKTGRFIRTLHRTLEAANARITGNSRHTHKAVVDTQPPKAG